MKPIRVLVADDHPIVRSGIASLLATQRDFDVVGEAANGEVAIAAAARLHPDVVLMDLRMPVRSGVEAAAAILAEQPAIKILVLTTYVTDSEVLRAVEVGAHGYLLKDVSHEDLFRAVRSVARGVRYLAPEVTDRLVNRWELSGRSLTDRELEVLRFVSLGEGNKQIAASLGIAEATVKAHLVHIFEKLGVENRTAAARVAREHGLIESD
jgi:DNA-binding NarL/FixJ family response regulator